MFEWIGKAFVIGIGFVVVFVVCVLIYGLSDLYKKNRPY